MAKNEINRYAVLPDGNTPKNIAVVKIYSDRDAAEEYARQAGGTVAPALDVDALMEHQERGAF